MFFVRCSSLYKANRAIGENTDERPKRKNGKNRKIRPTKNQKTLPKRPCVKHQLVFIASTTPIFSLSTRSGITATQRTLTITPGIINNHPNMVNTPTKNDAIIKRNNKPLFIEVTDRNKDGSYTPLGESKIRFVKIDALKCNQRP